MCTGDVGETLFLDFPKRSLSSHLNLGEIFKKLPVDYERHQSDRSHHEVVFNFVLGGFSHMHLPAAEIMGTTAAAAATNSLPTEKESRLGAPECR